MIKLTAIQLTSTAKVSTNLAKIEALLAKATKEANSENDVNDIAEEKIEHLVVLPECCLYFGGKDVEQLSLAKQSAETDELCESLGRLANKFNVYLVAGTVPILTAATEKFTNSSCLFNPNGEVIGRYDKIHLFDVNVCDNTNSYHESRYTQAGQETCVVSTPIANIGLSVCFDLRFPTLFQQLMMKGADIITIPSAFTKVTGKAHWQALLQARAIENQVYIIAAGQEGIHDNGRETWGHSMIINPWGEIEKCITTDEGYISINYNPEKITSIRKSMPLTTPLNMPLDK